MKIWIKKYKDGMTLVGIRKSAIAFFDENNAKEFKKYIEFAMNVGASRIETPDYKHWENKYQFLINN